MAKTLTLTARASVTWDYAKTDSDLGDLAVASSFSYSQAFTSGTAASQCDLLYVAKGTIAASGTTNLDLYGTLTDRFGDTLSMHRVKVLYVENTVDTASALLYVGGHATAAWYSWFHSATDSNTDQPAVKVRNGGSLFLCAPDVTGYAVTNTTADLLSLVEAGGVATCTYRVAIAGCSA